MVFYWVTREYVSPKLLIYCQSFGVVRLSFFTYTIKIWREPLAFFFQVMHVFLHITVKQRSLMGLYIHRWHVLASPIIQQKYFLFDGEFCHNFVSRWTGEVYRSVITCCIMSWFHFGLLFVSITPFHCSMSRAVTPYDLVSFFFFFVKL